MTLEPVSATARAPAVRPLAPGQQDRAAPDPALQLRLVLGADAAGELLARDARGQVYRLGGLGSLPQWTEGQTLLVQVLRAGPPLELRVLGTVARDTATLPFLGTMEVEGDPPALRPDQAAILRLAAAATDTMAQAALWRQRTLAALQQSVTVEPGDSSLAAPGVRPGAGPEAAPEDAGPTLLRLLPWHGWPLSLWIEQRRWTGGANRRARRRAGTRLCLSLALPPWGTVALVLDVLDVQVGLTLVTTEAEAVAPLRNQVGAIAARLVRAGLRLMRCHVRHVPGFQVPTSAKPPTGLAEHELPLALFRAGAEALEALRRSG